MKAIRINRTARLTGLTIALALFAGAAEELKAQNGAKGGATRLLELTGGLVTPMSEPSNYNPMSCAKCKDKFSHRVDWVARGANKPTVLVPKHLCDACATAISVEGQGKGKHDVVTHKCGACGAEALACCNTRKGSKVATIGMEKKFEIAPLK